MQRKKGDTFHKKTVKKGPDSFRRLQLTTRRCRNALPAETCMELMGLVHAGNRVF